MGNSEEVWRNEPVLVVIHLCMETTQGISLYSYSYLKLAKMSCFPYYLLCLSSRKLENKREEQILWGKGDKCKK
jgi:hypothetical protein